jgi:putative endonuclease
MVAYVYVLTNKHNRVLYTGVTGNLRARLVEHKEGASWFTAKYKTNKLVYYEYHEGIESAIVREKKIKNMSREQKLRLISSKNETWQDLTETLT